MKPKRKNEVLTMALDELETAGATDVEISHNHHIKLTIYVSRQVVSLCRAGNAIKLACRRESEARPETTVTRKRGTK